MIFIEAFLMVLIVVGVFLAIVIPVVALVVFTMMVYTQSPLTNALPVWARRTLRVAYPIGLLYLVSLIMLMCGASVW